jgi:hypothetical protein
MGALLLTRKDRQQAGAGDDEIGLASSRLAFKVSDDSINALI